MRTQDIIRPKAHETSFVSNNKSSNTIVLKALQRELLSCSGFSLSVAFITLQGITMILEQLKVLKENNIKGRILTSTYQMFNKPEVYRRLLKFEHIEVKVYSEEIHHTKGYIFNKEDRKTVMIGSSNLTEGALKVNREWNLKVEQAENIEMTQKLMFEFEDMWQKAEMLSEAWIDNYEEAYQRAESLRKDLQKLETKEKKIIPNKMQVEALRNLEYLRSKGEDKALLISATGTGKTYLSAFDIRNFNPKRALFIIHREQIARDAKRTFEKVMPEKQMGILSGTQKDLEAEILFTTIQSISLDHHLYHFKENHFDYIVYDEAHRTGAKSYLKTLNHFKPKFTLGMSATPERTDQYDIFEHFDYNIAYEIRLQGALEEDMLAPFHYFGVTDVSIDGETIDDKTKIANLVSKHRVDSILENIEYYGYSGKKLKGLMFCSSNEEARLLSAALNELGLNTISLSGSDDQNSREKAISQLSDDQDPLQYILTVDIFNEGIDIPDINQIVMLRPTQSAIIFVQQLGRGLRKSVDKEFVVVIDFIGNYKNNFMIPIALSGDRTFSQNNLRKYIMSGNSLIPGTSTIEFDRVSKERIYKSINQGVFTKRVYLRKEYENLKNKLGKIPRLVDFLDYESLDPQIFFDQRPYDNYHKFLRIVDKDYDTELSEEESQILSFISVEFSSGKRYVELYILEKFLYQDLKINDLFDKFSKNVVESALNYLTLDFMVSAEKPKYQHVDLLRIENDMLKKSNTFKEALKNNNFKIHYVDLLHYSKKHHALHYQKIDEVGFVVGKQYTRKDASWLLNWTSDQKGTIYGYKVDHETKTIPLFVTYKKSKKIEESIMYEDYFIDHETFNWMSRNRATLDSKEIKTIIDAKDKGYQILLFVKRSDGEKKHFYYLGLLDVLNYFETSIISKGEKLPIVNFIYKIKNPVRDDLYTYLTED